MNRKQILTLLAVGIGILLIAVDLLSINVAVPAIQKSFQVSLETVEWLVNGYMLAFGVLLVTAGRLADTYGRKKIFLIGIGMFGIASLIGGLSEDAGLLIAMRVIQGAAGALMWPSVIGIAYSTVSKEHKGLAIGLVFGVAGLGNCLGPLFGGILTEYISWRWVLFINVPLALTAFFISMWFVEEQSGESDKKDIDYVGITTISLSLVTFLYALNQSPTWGWLSKKTFGLLVISVIFFFFFLKYEKQQVNALIPEDVMHNRAFMKLCFTITILAPGFFVIFLYLPQYLEKLLNFSPVAAGAGLIPLMFTYAITSPFSGKFYNRLGGRVSIFLGLLITSFGTFGIVLFGFGGSYYHLVVPFLITGFGTGIALPCINTAAVGSVKESRASLAGGLTMMFQMCGAALGLAIVTTIFIDTVINDLVSRISSLGLDLSSFDIANVKSFIVGSGNEEIFKNEMGEKLVDSILPYIKNSYIKGLRIGLGFTGTMLLLGAIFSFFNTKDKEK